MAQLSPSTLEYGQLMVLVNEFMSEYRKGEFSSAEEVSVELKNIITKFNDIAGRPLLELESFDLGEPPSSEKMNRVWRMLEADMNIVQDQLNILRSAVIFLHNFISTEIQLAKNQNSQALNKLKTLQLYSNGHDGNVIQFGDYFSNLDFVDLTKVPADQKVSLLGSGIVTLGRESDSVNLTEDILMSVLNTSNGFIGKNQEINDPSTSITNPVDGNPVYSFKAETEGRHANPIYAIDGEPNTWFEYENHLVDSADRVRAKNFNFTYRQDAISSNTTTGVSPDGAASGTSTGTENEDKGLIDWAKGPAGGVLKLDLEFDLRGVKTINTISYTPFGLEQNKNAPVKVSLVQTSSNGTDWTPISPQNLWIATDANLQAARSSENVTIGTAHYTFDERNVRYVRMSIEQAQPIQANIGHLYYETRKTVITETKVVPDPEDVSKTKTITVETIVGGDRVEGPIPPIDQPDRYYNRNGLMQNGMVQSTEFFAGKRWAIGIRDILIQESKYKETSTLISKEFKIPGIVDRVSLESDVFIPPNFPSGNDIIWVRFYVTPDGGLNWYPISRIQDDYLGIPEVIAFNDPLPAEFREVGVSYVNTNSVVSSLRVKVEMSRPEDLESSSPIVRSYVLKVAKRQ